MEELSYQDFEKYEQSKPLNNKDYLEDRLNNLWITRCKANDELIDFIVELQNKGYTFTFSQEPTKQLELVVIKDAIKEVENETKKMKRR